MDYNILSDVFALMGVVVTFIDFICICNKLVKWCKKKRAKITK